MAARVLALRPLLVPARRTRTSAASRRTSRTSPETSPSVPWVRVERDDVRGLHVARCERCAEFFASSRPDEAEDWADAHRCDPELAALLADPAAWRAA
ncbi:hypothetical protein [Actinomadura atramentaria]|uniref:hypothetical protein n=1 Tax=Actinomadura atramentaria TaxID=1990 RepID=UPI0012FAABFC|nr:hypothetical protein [Actinomadura atramentaria]